MFAKLIPFALLLSSNCVSAMTLSETVEKYRQSVIYVKVAKADGTTGAVTEQHGTGFILNKDGYAVTAAHVVSGGPGLQVDVRGAVGSREGQLEPMEVLYESSNFDVALIRFKDTSKVRAPVLLGDPWARKDGDTIFVMGFPGTEEWFHSSGLLSGKGPKGSWNTTVVLNPGMSGGPAFDTDGAVVAMIWGGVATPGVTGLNRVLPINLLKEPLLFAETASSPSMSASASLSRAATPENVQEFQYAFSEIQTTHGGAQPATRTYEKTFNAQPGFRIIDYKVIPKSANKAGTPSTTLSADGKQLNVQFTLTSGPIFDQWRGWMDAEIQTRQIRDK
ncbi:S1 family peptidase [Achromobacter animicus]|uniref:S1 family peptidase n=1 Tax=Achromobacter animicus TaxID=1389935 RepID=UPI001467D3DA|nr:serine protease [Achromobacter animicus]CAB3854444.1 hypothetical protein LMG26691_02152 [Achromobacter animicus]